MPYPSYHHFQRFLRIKQRGCLSPFTPSLWGFGPTLCAGSFMEQEVAFC